MELPQPPADHDLKNIIDKLAQFVARNGQEFEQMTKTKQKDNQKFSFLFGGDFFNYYQYKVTTEQAVLKHRQNREQQGGPPPGPPMHGPPPGPPGQGPFPGGGPGFPPQGYPHNYGYPPNSGYPGSDMPPYPPHGMVPPGGYNQYNPPPPNCPPQQGEPQPNFPPPPNATYPPGEHPSNFSSPPSYPGGPPVSAPPPGTEQQPPPHFSHPPTPQPNFPPPPQQQQQQPQPDLGPPPGYSHPQGPPGDTSTYNGSGGGSGNPPPVSGGGGYAQPPPTTAGGPSGPPGGPPGPPPAGGPPQVTLESLVQQQQQLQEQIHQSEQNLAAQQQVLDQQKDGQIKEGIYVARGEILRKESTDLGFDTIEVDELLNPITESCTKDSISNGKHWIFTNSTSNGKNLWIARYLLWKSTANTGPFTHKLHIVYLMNDVLHHCVRKNAEDVKDALQKVLAPMFCNAMAVASNDQKAKLDKLLSLWESKIQLESVVLQQLKTPVESWKAFEQSLVEEFPQVVQTINQHITSTFEGYAQQHNAFVEHASGQIQAIEAQKAQLQQQQQALAVAAALAGPGGGPLPMVDFSKPPPGFPCDDKENRVPTVPYFELPAGLMAPLIKIDDFKYKPIDPADLRLPPPTPPSERLLRAVENFYSPPSHEKPRNSEGWEQLGLYDYYKEKSQAVKQKESDINNKLRDKSRSPSPVAIETPPEEEDLLPEQPARRYRSVSPEKLDENRKSRSESRSPSRSPPRRERSERRSRTRSRSRSRSLSPPLYQRSERSPPPAPPYKSMSPPLYQRSERSPPPAPLYQRSERSPPPAPLYQRSERSPPLYQRSERSPSPPRRSRRPRSRSPPRRDSSSRSPRRSRSRSRSPSGTPPPSRVPFKRSPSRSPEPPPSFLSGSFPAPEQRLDESNKGHQMLRKMGWGGSGLGAKEQGIANPIECSEVRDTPQERFRGLGVPSAQSDPYEAFRKNKGQAFINRMKARAEEKF